MKIILENYGKAGGHMDIRDETTAIKDGRSSNVRITVYDGGGSPLVRDLSVKRAELIRLAKAL